MTLKLAGIGELLWDLLPGGRQLGGAPANFAHHAHQLGAEAAVVSRVGADALGAEILELLRARGIGTEAVSIHPTLPTGTVTVAVLPDGQPEFTIHEQVAWDDLSCDGAALAVVGNADAVVFGTLAQRSAPARQAVGELLLAAPARCLRVFDINLRQHYHSLELIEGGMRAADVLKLNDVELDRLGPPLGLAGEARDRIGQLAARYKLALVALTRGAGGSLLFADGTFSDHPGLPASVVDTVGAGDAFTACLTMGWLHGRALDRINRHANEVAAFVCSQAGATPVLPPHLRG